ncbi:MAG: hypothetical protein GY803_32070 [Chloroflexi bacterium]|nr:hypothetical protein [Chloroflexota bacterium]
MAKVRLTIDSRLQLARLGIENGQSVPEIAAALAVYGFDAAKMQIGADLLTAAVDLHAVQKQEYSEQYAATSALNEARAAADKVYSTHRKLAKLALRDEPEAQKALLLHERKKGALDPWLGQAGIFYKNALGNQEALTALGRYNITTELLTAAQAAVVQVAHLNAAQEQERSEAQRATQERDAALDALHEWYSEFRALARIALADDPQLLEALGIVAPSE